MKEIILKGGNVLLTEKAAVYEVTKGTVLVFVALKKGSETGRRYFLTEINEGERIPSLKYVDQDGEWTFVLSAQGEAKVLEILSLSKKDIFEFADKIKLPLTTAENFGAEVIELINLHLITEEGFIYSVSQETKRTKEKGLTLIYNLFHKDKYTSRNGSSGNVLYDTVESICRFKRMEVADFDDIKESCGRRFNVEDIARISHFAYRKVVLEEGWHKQDSGPLLVFDKKKNKPYAAIPKGHNKYYLRDCEEGSICLITEENLADIKEQAYMFYRPLPNKKLNVFDLIKFSARSVNRIDIVNLIVMAAINALIGLLLPFMNQKIFDEYIPMGDSTTLFQISFLILSFTIGNMMFTIIKNIAIFRSSNSCKYDIQAAVFDRLYNLPNNFFNDYDSGDLGKRIMGFTSMFSILSEVVVNAVLTASFSLVYLYRMYKYSKKLANIGLILLILNAVIITVIGLVQIKYQRQITEINGKLTSRMYQIVGGISKVKIAGVEDRALLQYLEPYTKSKRVLLKKARLDNLSANINMILNTLFTVVFYYIMIAKQQDISFGEYMGFTSAFGYFSNAIVSLVNAFLQANNVVPMYQLAKPVLETCSELSEDTIMPGDINGKIEVNNVRFRYTKDGDDVLSDISLKIDKGEYIGIVGSSGSGKSTLIKLLLGFEKPTKGKIYYDDKDIESIDKRELRKKFGVVLQDGKLLSGSIYDNITINCGDMSQERVNEIIKMVGLKDDIDQMPMGIHTVIADGAGTISGGQKQRLLIARAIANNPSILFFDEATSALDNINQALVCESLEKLNATRIVIAHRLSTIQKCDRILVMDNGRIVEQGNYDELLKLKGLFYELASRQIA